MRAPHLHRVHRLLLAAPFAVAAVAWSCGGSISAILGGVQHWYWGVVGN